MARPEDPIGPYQRWTDDEATTQLRFVVRKDGRKELNILQQLWQVRHMVGVITDPVRGIDLEWRDVPTGEER